MSLYLTIKAVHIIAVISWMAGLLYLPRLFVYHSDAISSGSVIDVFGVMEGRLLRYIMNPAMIAVWLSGLALVFIGGFGTEIWMFLKIGLVFLLSGFHGFLGRERRYIGAGRNLRGSRFYRIINEIPTVIMILIVFIVVFKPS
jgi:protoporphyrinogen IX oxidase